MALDIADCLAIVFVALDRKRRVAALVEMPIADPGGDSPARTIPGGIKHTHARRAPIPGLNALAISTPLAIGKTDSEAPVIFRAEQLAAGECASLVAVDNCPLNQAIRQCSSTAAASVM
jgi:hypothetical protein